MKLTITINFPKLRNPVKIPYYLRTYRKLRQPQWANPTRKIGWWGSLKLWWIIEGELRREAEER